MESEWLRLARELQAIAQNGLAFVKDPYDRERYERVREISAQLMALGSDGDLEYIRGLFSDQQGYATPKVDVRGVVMKGDSILFVRERSDGLWTLPGGWADPCYSPRQCVEKELREESGLETKAVKLLAVYDRSNHSHPPFAFQVYKLFFLCSVVGGRLSTSTETSEIRFLREEVDELSTARVTREQISRMFEHVKNPDWATDFD